MLNLSKLFHKLMSVVLIHLSLCVTPVKSSAQTQPSLKFEISFTSAAHVEAITGRVYVIVTRNKNIEPRFQTRRAASAPFFGKDVESLKPGEAAIIDKEVPGFPLKSIVDIPPGEYYVQGFVNNYTEFKRSDGHTIWLHNDHWEGQQWNRSPGNIYRDVTKIKIDPFKL